MPQLRRSPWHQSLEDCGDGHWCVLNNDNDDDDNYDDNNHDDVISASAQKQPLAPKLRRLWWC